jgi:hypothetical protein
MIQQAIEHRRRALAHSNALEAKRQAEHQIALLRSRYLDALHNNDVLAKAALDVEYREVLKPAWKAAAEAERNARAELETTR